jgi:hypothetical protein
MKKKNITLLALLGMLITFITPSQANDEYLINVADVTPPAPAAAPAPAAPPVAPPAVAAAPAVDPNPVKEIDFNKPLVPESQFFQYACLNSKNVTLRTLSEMDCDLFRDMYNEDPQRAVDHLSLLLLIQRVLEGCDVRNMPAQDRVDLAYATILGEIRKYGRNCEARGYMGIGEGECGECKDRLIIPSVGALCQVFEGVKGAILLELYHVHLIFPVS